LNASTPSGLCANTSERSATTDTSPGAYELKFLIPDELADGVLRWARSNLSTDPHADRTRGDGYQVNSLYFDTAAFDVYHRLRAYGRRKFRLRRYGSETRVFLERKARANGLVRKRRTVVGESDVALLDAANAEPAWAGDWFRRRLVARKLVPACNMSYERVARVGMTQDGPIRLTVDRGIRCQRAAGLSVPSVVHGMPVLTGQSILEFKYRIAMPALFKDALEQFNLYPTSVSKYRLSIGAGANVTPTLHPLSPAHELCSHHAPRDVPHYVDMGSSRGA
jgi:hypothetical protein